MKLFDVDEKHLDSQDEVRPANGWVNTDDEQTAQQDSFEDDDKITLYDVKEFFIRYKFFVWLISVIPFIMFIPDELLVLRIILLTIQLSAFGILCWVTWKDIFKIFNGD